MSLKKFINKAINIHNNLYCYDKVIYNGCKSKILIICNTCNNEFYQTPDNHLQGKGCPNVSKKHRQFNIYIDKVLYKVDAYNPDTNTIYEFYGDYWHGNPNKFDKTKLNINTNTTFGILYEKTIQREMILKNNGFNIIYIWESDWKNA